MVITYRNYLEEYLLCALYILCNHTGHQGECLFFVISRRFFYKSYNFCNQHAICLSTFKICFSFQINARLFKGGFFQKVWCVFQFSKKYSKLLSWTWNLNFPPITVNNKFKFQAQDSNLEYFYFGDLEIWKTICTFWKKPPLVGTFVWWRTTTYISRFSSIICHCLLKQDWKSFQS